ncbi:hypothetical protein LguiB_026325 [Lonicera macranthoides]
MSAKMKLEVCDDDDAEKTSLKPQNSLSHIEVRKWEDLSMDCLVNILGRVGMESLILDIPFVCKSWYNATFSPLCWQNLDFSTVTFFGDFKLHFKQRVRSELRVWGKFCFTGFVKYVLLRSGGSATKIVFPSRCRHDALVLAANVCPALKMLELPNFTGLEHEKFKVPIRNWENLESLTLKSRWNTIQILREIGIHCKNFASLSFKKTDIGESEALAIVTNVPNIKSLTLKQCEIKGVDLVKILKGCNRLSYFDISYCSVCNIDDSEMLELASRIATVKYIPPERELTVFGDRLTLGTCFRRLYGQI